MPHRRLIETMQSIFAIAPAFERIARADDLRAGRTDFDKFADAKRPKKSFLRCHDAYVKNWQPWLHR